MKKTTTTATATTATATTATAKTVTTVERTATIKLFDKNEFKFVTVAIKLPNFVINPVEFAKMVNSAHINSERRKLNKAIEKATDKYNEAILEKDIIEAEEEKKKAIKALNDFDKLSSNVATSIPDAIVTMYCFSMGYVSGTLEVAGFDNIYRKTSQYGYRFIGAEEWTDDRKSEFSGIKAGCNTFLSEKFDTSNKELYKGFDLTLRSSDIEMFINSVFGTYTRQSTGKKEEKIFGIGQKATSKDKAFILLCKAVFFRYGCDIIKVKATKHFDYKL